MFTSTVSSLIRKLLVLVVLAGALCLSVNSPVVNANPYCCSFCDFANEECQGGCDEILGACWGCIEQWENCNGSCWHTFTICENNCDPGC